MNTQRTPMDEQQEADRLDRAYKAWIAGTSAPPDDGLDPALAQTAQRVANGLAAPHPTAEFGAVLQGRLDAAVSAASSGAQAQPKPAARRFVFGATPWRVAAALVLAALIGVYLLSLRPAPVSAQEIVRRAQAALASPAATGLQSYFLAEQRSFWSSKEEGTGEGEPLLQSHSEMRRWFQAPNRWRMETQGQTYAADGQPAGTGSWHAITVSDGSSQYDYDAAANSVSINVAATDLPDAEITGANSLPQLFERMATCYRPQVTGSDEVAGQPVYVVDLGPTLCPSASAPEANGREVIWVDKNTFFVLKHELYSTAGDQLIMRSAATEVQYNPTLDAALFTFTPPAGARVVDYRPQALPTASTAEGADAGPQSALLGALQQLAQGVDFPLFAPSTIPEGLAPRLPKIMPLSDTFDQLQIELVPADAVEEDVYAGQEGIVIMQQAADYASVVNFTQKTTPVLLPGEPGQASGAQAWARRGFTDVYGTGSDSGVIVLRGGVLITLNSFAYGPEELLEVAADLQPVPGSHAALPNPQPPTLAEVRASAPFTFFVPTWVPEGLTAEPPVGYSITYHDHSGEAVLTVSNNTGLADDPRYAGEAATLSNGLAAHWLGSMLWWVQDGTPIALSSDSLSREDLLRVAASMSSSAELGAVELPPQPTPAPALPTPTPQPTPAFAALRPTWLPEEMNERRQVDGEIVSMGFTPAAGDSNAALVLVQMPATPGEDLGASDPQASTEQIGPYTVTVIRRGAEGCVTYTWEANGLRLTLTNVYGPPGTLKYSCAQMAQIVAGIR